MASEGPFPAGSVGEDTSNGGTLAWTSQANAHSVHDGLTANAGDGLSSGSTSRLVLYGYAFTAVSGTVLGIEVTVYRSGLIGCSDFEIYLTKDGGGTNAVAGSNHGVLGAWPTSITPVTYGSSADTWGAGLTAADIRSSSFGVLIAASLGTTAIAHVDAVEVTVYYSSTAPADGTFPFLPISNPPRLRATVDAVPY